MTEISDVNLWPRIRDGDPEAFAQLFDRHGARVHAYALRRTADPGAADDVTALVFLEVWRRRREVELHQPSALPWLFGVAGNVIRRWHRTRRRHRDALDRLTGLPAPSPALVEQQAEAAAEAASVLEQIRRLPRRERDVLMLSVWEGLSHTEIAVALGVPVGTVKSRLARARDRLDPTRRPAIRPSDPRHEVAATPVAALADIALKEIP
jgi:RNA polymerase sigma factor (sigma-70 family)